MALISWNDSYGVGVLEIDLQHQKLIGMINDFYDQIDKDYKDYGQAFKTLLDALVEYTCYHFSTEEKYFKEFGYAEAEKHIKMHRVFREKVFDVRDRLSQGQLVVSFEITTFLKEWLTHHIKEMDKAYSQCFHDHGLS